MPKPSFVRTLTLTLGSIVILFFIDTSLATVERSQSREDAERSYREGQLLMQQGRSQRAATEFSAALTNSRDNARYQLALGQAQAAAGLFSNAEDTLKALLEEDGQDGTANLAMARILVKEKRLSEAFSYYHRAIYGEWAKDPRGNRVQVRFELVDLLAAQPGHEGLLAEVLPLQAEAPEDTDTKMKLGQLFVTAGAPARGSALFREVLRKEPRNADAWLGLGESEFARDSYRAALSDFQSALRFRPGDDHARQRAEAAEQALKNPE